MYYQFLIERKLPNGVLRHIASNEEVITYEFIPNNYEGKRRKLKETLEPNSELLLSNKEENKEQDLDSSTSQHPEENPNEKDTDIKRHKIRIRSNLNLDYNKP